MIGFYWYSKVKRVTMTIMTFVFLSLSFIVLYAEIASIFGVQNNIVYNIVTQPDFTASYLAQNVYFIHYSFRLFV